MNKIAGVVYIVIGNIFWGNYQTVLQNVTLAIRSIKELEEKGVFHSGYEKEENHLLNKNGRQNGQFAADKLGKFLRLKLLKIT